MAKIRGPRDLCTLDEVKRLLPRYTEPASQPDRDKADALLLDLIGSASSRVMEVAGREFVSQLDLGDTTDTGGTVWPDAPSETRSFDTILNPQTPGAGRGAAIPVGDMTAVTGLAVSTRWSTATPTALSPLSTYTIAEPRDRGPYYPIRRLRLLGGTYEGQVYAVTGRWGWPVVPDDIRMAVAEQAAIWANRDLATYSQTFLQAAASGAFPTSPRALDQSVYDAALLYRIPSIG